VKRALWIAGFAAVLGLLAAPAGAGPRAYRCAPTATDAFGPFGRGTPPLRAKIGTGHVLTGVVLSALNCAPIPGARVELWQSNAGGQYTVKGSGTVIAGRDGRFRFEGPFPPSYETLPPHIHIRVVAKDYLTLVTRYVVAPHERRGSIRLVLRPIAL
jgi:protocatechuate 3,4-dioxygenase beta subunit